MPSSNKTSHLLLNKWLGSDKPKKDDFNADNQKIDDACHAIRQEVAGVDTAQKSTAQTVSNLGSRCDSLNTSLGGLSKTVSDLDTLMTGTLSSLNTTNSNLSGHTGNGTVHISAAERTAWNAKSEMVSGTYDGNGAAQRTISLGFQPKFGLLFAKDQPPVRIFWAATVANLHAGFFSVMGCSENIELTASGFTVYGTVGNAPDNFHFRYNESGQKYVYVAWR